MRKILKIDRKCNNRNNVLRQERIQRIHSKILKAKEKLDNVGQNDNKKKEPSYRKISTRLFLKQTLGIYRNGAKGEDIQNNIYSKNQSGSTFERARLNADALKLLNGTSENKEEPSTWNENIEQLPNKTFVQNSLNWTQGTPEESPILGENKHLNLNKNKKNLFKCINSEKQNNESDYVAQKENKFNLFQNDDEQSEDITQMQIFNNDDFMKENENMMQKTLEDNPNLSGEVKCYEEVCEMASNINFGKDFQMKQPDPFTTTVEELQHISKAREHAHEKVGRQAIKHQIYDSNIDYSDISQDSTPDIRYEVPNNSENSSKADLDIDDYAEIIGDTIANYGSMSCSSRDSVVSDDTDDCIIENRENNNNSKQPADIYRLTRNFTPPTNFFFVNKKDSIQKDFNYSTQFDTIQYNNLPKIERCNKDHFNLNFRKTPSCIDNPKHAETSFALKKFMLFDNTLKNYTCEETAIDLSNKTTKCNARNVEQSDIRYNNVTAERDRSVEKSDYINFGQCLPDLVCKKYGTYTNNENPDNERYVYTDRHSFRQEFLREKRKQESEAAKSLDQSIEHQARTHISQMPNLIYNANKDPNKNLIKISLASRKDVSQREDKLHCAYFSTPIINTQFVNFDDQIETSESQIESIEMKNSENSQELPINQFDRNICTNKLDGRNKLYRVDNLQTLKALCNTNSYMERLSQERVKPLKKRHFYNILNYEHDNSECSTNNNIDVQSTKLSPQQNQLYTSENDGIRESFENDIHYRNRNAYFNYSNPVIRSSWNRNKRLKEPLYIKRFDKPNLEYFRNQTDLYHRENQYVYSNSPDQRLYNTSHLFEDAAQPSTSRIEDPNMYSGTDNYINLTNVPNIPKTLFPKQKYITRPEIYDHRHRAVSSQDDVQYHIVSPQDVAQPVKYFAADNNSDIQRVAVYVKKDESIVKSIPMKVTQTRSNPEDAQELSSYFHNDYKYYS